MSEHLDKPMDTPVFEENINLGSVGLFTSLTYCDYHLPERKLILDIFKGKESIIWAFLASLKSVYACY